MDESETPNFEINFDFLMACKENEEPTSVTRFVTLTEEDRNKLIEDSMSKKTKFATKWVVTLFKGKHQH